MSQERLAEEIGISLHQLQKYECGANRTAASRLWDLSVALDVPVSFFLDDIAPEIIATRPCLMGVRDPMIHPTTRDLIDAYHRIPDPAVRQALLHLIRAAGGAG